MSRVTGAAVGRTDREVLHARLRLDREMPEIEITDDQLSYLDDLRDQLAAEHVGAYGTVRPRDALQFLIDRHEGDAAALDEAAAAADDETDATDETDGSNAGDEADGASAGEESGGPGRLQAMMQLLEEHEDKWEEVDSEQGKYAVTLPDGETETVRTKDDVRGLLFKHY